MGNVELAVLRLERLPCSQVSGKERWFVLSWETQTFLLLHRLDNFGLINRAGGKDQKRFLSFPLDCKQKKTKDLGKNLPLSFMTQFQGKETLQHSSWSTQWKTGSFHFLFSPVSEFILRK